MSLHAGPTTQVLPPTIEADRSGHGPGRDAPDPQAANPLHRLTPQQIDELGAKFEAIHDEVRADLGERDVRYIKNLVTFHRRLAAVSRIALLAARYPPALVVGTLGLSVAKIIENMELGHNILHGQWDWMNDPEIHSSTWDWDNVSTAAGWKHSHNVVHHTYTNIIGKDKDVGYEVMRVNAAQPWEPRFLAQPAIHGLLMAFFEWGVALHDLDFEAMALGKKDPKVLRRELKEISKKAGRQMLKDYVLFPALSGRAWKKTLAANFTANLARNVWANAIIFCGHFPDQAYTFSEAEVAGETRGAWYVRQLLGSCNIEGGPTFHLMSGNLSYQIEHHLFPDLPSSRYAEIAPRVRAICEEYGLPYNTGPFISQWLMVQKSILRYTFPGGDTKATGEPHHEPPAAAQPVPTMPGAGGPQVAFP